jgi:phosphopantetheinyl transferase/acyl carrier protein
MGFTSGHVPEGVSSRSLAGLAGARLPQQAAEAESAGRTPELISGLWHAPVVALGQPGRLVCCRLDALPGEPEEVAARILNESEQRFWQAMRAVDKRRREWLMGRAVAKDAVRVLLERHCAARLAAAEIDIAPDPYGRPQAEGAWVEKLGVQPSVSISHSFGTAVAMAALDAGQGVGIDLENVHQRRENFESIAFSGDERDLLSALESAIRQEWALRMWCAKESVGKALGRGLSAGMQAFHITGLELASGLIRLELRAGALEQFPRLRDQTLEAHTLREGDFVFSALTYQQGAVRMRPSRQQIQDYLLQKMVELTQDWDYAEPVGPESKLFTELGFESLDAVVLCTAIQEHYQTPMPFAELLAEIGQQQRDLSINELTDFVNTHLSGPAADGATGRPQ